MGWLHWKVMRSVAVGLFMVGVVGTSSSVRADYSQRVSLGFGLISSGQTSQTSAELSLQYENRVNALVGLGGGGNYIFSAPALTLLAAPEVFIHPLLGEFYVSGAPLLELGSGSGTYFGGRLSTRVPIPLVALTLVPSFSIDAIHGSRNLIFGLGLEF